ncbi:MAG TPA: MarR family transcriptional regulator [Rhodocyclaceae bacterium]|jgi:DNA-binding MarR family transcriptional regulator|nr:MarR family transcriptional regulator [Rhodocyclaceae bacterium]
MFEQCLYFNTTSLARKLEREWTVAFKPFGLTPSQAFLLRTILAKPGNHQRDLADGMNVTTPTMSRTLDGLSKLGFVERRGSDQDTRGIQVFPTDKALVIHDELNAASGKVTKKLKKLLGTGEFDDVVSRLKAISAAL